MPTLADQSAITGPLTAADLDAARQRSTGSVYLRRCPPCHGQCRQGRDCSASADEASAPEGGQYAEPAPSGTRCRAKRRAGALLGLLLVLLCWLPVLVAAAVLLRLYR